MLITDCLNQPGPDIPVLSEQLAILVSTGNARETIGLQLLTQEEFKCLNA